MATVPNTIKETLLQINLGPAAMILELIAYMGFGPGDRLEYAAIRDLVALLEIQIQESYIRRGLKLLVKHGLISWRPIHNRKRGRPTIEYGIGSWEGMAKMLGVELHKKEHCDAVDRDAFRRIRSYRQQLYIAYLRRNPGQISRYKLGRRLGVKARTTRNYEKGTNIIVTPKYDSISLLPGDELNAPKTRQRDKFFIRSYNSTLTEYKTYPYTEFIVMRELAMGNKVFKVWQTANHYQVAA